MAQFFEFVSNHIFLTGLFVALLIAFFVNEGKRGGAALSAQSLVRLFNQGDALILDVRDDKDFKQGHILGSVNIPFSSIDSRYTELEKDKEKTIVIVCKMGQHAAAAGRKLKAFGFEDIRRLSGGLSEWSALNLPLVKK